MFVPSKMKDSEFRKLSRIVEEYAGIRMPLTKKELLTARLNRRLRTLKYDNFESYYEYVTSPRGQKIELPLMIDQVTTNKTDFFREADHFHILTTQVLPHLLSRKPEYEPLRIWSAGCSSGEEVYTLAMILDDYFNRFEPRPFTIHGTDICGDVLEIAGRGIYNEKDIIPIPFAFRKKYLLRGKNEKQGLYRVIPELRMKTGFQYLNLIKEASFHIGFKPDIIFCRNVIIYFERETQQELFVKFFNILQPGGFLFIGHSETLHGINGRFIQEGVSLYSKPLQIAERYV